jgi:hypothetical protein
MSGTHQGALQMTAPDFTKKAEEYAIRFKPDNGWGAGISMDAFLAGAKLGYERGLEDAAKLMERASNVLGSHGSSSMAFIAGACEEAAQQIRALNKAR